MANDAEHIRQTLEGVDFDAFFKQDEEAAPRKRTRNPSEGQDAPMPQIKKPIAPYKCRVDGAGGLSFRFEFVPVDHGKAVQIRGDTVKLREWIKKQFAARWNQEENCWTVKLVNGLTFESLIFRVKYCASRSWNNVPCHIQRFFELRNMDIPSFMCDPNRAYDKLEATKTKLNLARFLEKNHISLLYGTFINGLCHYCGYDLFYFSCYDSLPSRCPGCGKH